MTLCEKCTGEIIPEEWSEAGWGPGPHCGIGICGCAEGIPLLQEGDIIVDRGFMAWIVERCTYGYVAENIMSVQRPNYRGALVTIWSRKK
jgi:hypothetical protein